MTENELCNICIEIMQWWSNNTGLGYGAINVILFVIIAPVLILTTSLLTMISIDSNNRKLKLFTKIVSTTVFASFIIGTILLVGLPAIDIFLDLHHG